MQILEVCRLTRQESIREAIASPVENDAIPAYVSLGWLVQRTGKTDNTLKTYRTLAFQQVGVYWADVLYGEDEPMNGAYFLAGKGAPDKPPFNRLRAEILIEISDLFDKLGNAKLVIAELNQIYTTPQQLQEIFTDV